jgi:hypothetical protein
MPLLRHAPLAVEFDLGTVAQVRLEGHLHLLNVPGHGWPHPVSSPADIARAEQECITWALQKGLVREGEPYFHKFCQSRLAALAACTLPDVPIHRSKWFIYLQAFIFTLDDALDNLVDLRAGAQYLPYGLLQETFGLFMSMLTGEVPRALRPPASEFPLLEPFCEVLRDIREHALETEVELSWFLSSMADYFEAVAWEHGAHTETGYTPTVSTYMHNREQTISYLQSVESFLAIKRIRLSRERRQLHPVKLLLTNACRHVILVNDVFSLAKELACGELDNVLLLDPGQNREALLRRFKSLLERLNALAADITYISLKLRDTYPEDRQILGFVDTILYNVNGHVAWYAESRRYGHFVRPPALAVAEEARAATH